MESLIFIAGDLDFRPLFEAIVADGMDVSLYYGEGAAEDLVHAADQKVPLTLERLYQHCSESYKQRNQLPHTALVTSIGANAIEIGKVDGKEFARLEKNSDGSFGIIDTRNPNGYIYYGSCESPEKLKHFYDASVEKCEWEEYLTHSG